MAEATTATEATLAKASGANAQRRRKRPVFAGTLAGAVWFAAPQAEALLFRTEPRDPLSSAIGVSIVPGMSALAAVVPALRISRFQPAQTLRE